MAVMCNDGNQPPCTCTWYLASVLHKQCNPSIRPNSDINALVHCFYRDLSLWSFEKLADTKLGVIAVEHREVPCWQKPNKPAKNPWGQRSGPDRGPPGNWNPAMDKRPFKQILG